MRYKKCRIGTCKRKRPHSLGILLRGTEISAKNTKVRPICLQSILLTVTQLDGCIVWNAHNTVRGDEALLIHIVPGCYVKQVGMERPIISLLVYTGKIFQLLRLFH